MKKLCIAAALLLTATSAHAANSFSFKINGQSVRIDVPRNCQALSCISITAPGLKFSDPDGDAEPAAPTRTEPQASPAPPASSAVAPMVPADPPTASAPAPSSMPEPRVSAIAPSFQETMPPRQPDPQALPEQPAQYPVADAPAPPVAAPVNSPLGTWMTEKKEGLVRIEACGANICGYSVNARTNQNGEKVLIDMRPAGADKWKGRIHDTRNGGGGTYDSTIALRGDQLRVTGCAFGGMFCGGQTWTRMN